MHTYTQNTLIERSFSIPDNYKRESDNQGSTVVKKIQVKDVCNYKNNLKQTSCKIARGPQESHGEKDVKFKVAAKT